MQPWRNQYPRINRVVHSGRTGGKNPRARQGGGVGEGAGETRGEGKKPSQPGGEQPVDDDEGGRTTGTVVGARA